MGADDGMSGARALSFVAGGRLLALPAERIAEVLLPPPLARVPLAPPGLRGLANVRGRLAPVLALGLLLGEVDAEEARVIIVEGEHPIGLAVAQVRGVGDADGAAWLDLGPVVERVLADLPTRREGGTEGGDSQPAIPLFAPEATFLTFEVAGQSYGLPLSDVRAVAPAPERLAARPQDDPAIRGVAEVRGRLTPVVALRTLLGFGSAPPAPSSRLVLVEVAGTPVALQVDAVRGLVRAQPGDIQPTPPLLNRGAGEARIGRMVRSPQGLVAVLDPERLFDAATTARLAANGGGDVAEPRGEAEEATEAFLSFRLGDERYAFPASAIEALTPAPSNPAAAPNTPAFLVGMMSHRGAVVPLIDQRRRFGVNAPRAARPQVIVTRVDGIVAGLVVDRVERVLALPSSELAPATALPGDARLFDRAVMAGGSRPLLTVDPRALLDQAERDIVQDWVGHAKSAA